MVNTPNQNTSYFKIWIRPTKIRLAKSKIRSYLVHTSINYFSTPNITKLVFFLIPDQHCHHVVFAYTISYQVKALQMKAATSSFPWFDEVNRAWKCRKYGYYMNTGRLKSWKIDLLLVWLANGHVIGRTIWKHGLNGQLIIILVLSLNNVGCLG